MTTTLKSKPKLLSCAVFTAEHPYLTIFFNLQKKKKKIKQPGGAPLPAIYLR